MCEPALLASCIAVAAGWGMQYGWYEWLDVPGSAAGEGHARIGGFVHSTTNNAAAAAAVFCVRACVCFDRQARQEPRSQLCSDCAADSTPARVHATPGASKVGRTGASGAGGHNPLRQAPAWQPHTPGRNIRQGGGESELLVVELVEPAWGGGCRPLSASTTPPPFWALR